MCVLCAFCAWLKKNVLTPDCQKFTLRTSAPPRKPSPSARTPPAARTRPHTPLRTPPPAFAVVPSALFLSLPPARVRKVARDFGYLQHRLGKIDRKAMQPRGKKRPLIPIGAPYQQLDDNGNPIEEPFWTSSRVKIAAVALAVLSFLFVVLWLVYFIFTPQPNSLPPPSPPQPPTHPMRAMGAACCETDWATNQSLECRSWVCSAFGVKAGLGGNGRCGAWDESNDFHSFGFGRPLHWENGEYDAYASHNFGDYTAALSSGNVSQKFFVANGVKYLWDANDDPRYYHRCCPSTERGVSSEEGLCLDLPQESTCQDPRQAGAYPPQQSEGDAYVTGLYCGWAPVDETIQDPNPVSMLYNPLDAIRNGRLAAGRGEVPFETEGAGRAKDRRLEIAKRMKITYPSYWGQLVERSNGTDGLARKVSRLLLPGEPACMADGQTCYDHVCGGAGAAWGAGWPNEPTMGRNGKAGFWGLNDSFLFLRSDGSANHMYHKRCCPWTERGATFQRKLSGYSDEDKTEGLCSDLPEGSTCHLNQQCGSFPMQRPSDGSGEDGSEDPIVSGLFCGFSPMFETKRHENNSFATYGLKDYIEDGTNPALRQHNASWLKEHYEYDTPQDWDPSNLLKKCTKVLLPGEPCGSEDGTKSFDWMCGMPAFNVGAPWANMLEEFGGKSNGRCKKWGGDIDPSRFPNTDGIASLRYKYRCCPWTNRSATWQSDYCMDIPDGGSCTHHDQCQKNMVCGHNNTCHSPMPTGEPCCDPATGTDCRDFICGETGSNWRSGWPGMDHTLGGHGKCGLWGQGVHHSQDDNTDDSVQYGLAYTKRCCPSTARGAGTANEMCYDLPKGADCIDEDQCAQGLVCGMNYTCHEPLDLGEPCCDDNGADCKDYLCGPSNANYGIGWDVMQEKPHGKCGFWDGANDETTFGLNSRERCCPHTAKGGNMPGNICFDLPFGATCQRLDQCTDGLVCGHNSTCHHPLGAGSPCCDDTGNTCTDTVCGPYGGIGDWNSTGGNGRCGIWYDGDSASLGLQYSERCCVQTLSGSNTGTDYCGDIPTTITFETTVEDQTMTTSGTCSLVEQCSNGHVCDLRGKANADSMDQTLESTCVPVFDEGSACCNTNALGCSDAYCGPVGENWGSTGNGRCAAWNSAGDVTNVDVTGSATEDKRYHSRCCPNHYRGSKVDSGNCHYIPEGGTCTGVGQCADGLYCETGDGGQCTAAKVAGASCCDAGTGECHDEYCQSGACRDYANSVGGVNTKRCCVNSPDGISDSLVCKDIPPVGDPDATNATLFEGIPTCKLNSQCREGSYCGHAVCTPAQAASSDTSRSECYEDSECESNICLYQSVGSIGERLAPGYCLKEVQLGGEVCSLDAHCASGQCLNWDGAAQQRYCAGFQGDPCNVTIPTGLAPNEHAVGIVDDEYSSSMCNSAYSCTLTNVTTGLQYADGVAKCQHKLGRSHPCDADEHCLSGQCYCGQCLEPGMMKGGEICGDGDDITGYGSTDCASGRCMSWSLSEGDTQCHRLCYSMDTEPCEVRSSSTWVGPTGDHSHASGAAKDMECLGPESGTELSCWNNVCTSQPPLGARCFNDRHCLNGTPNSMCEQGGWLACIPYRHRLQALPLTLLPPCLLPPLPAPPLPCLHRVLHQLLRDPRRRHLPPPPAVPHWPLLRHRRRRLVHVRRGRALWRADQGPRVEHRLLRHRCRSGRHRRQRHPRPAPAPLPRGGRRPLDRADHPMRRLGA